MKIIRIIAMSMLFTIPAVSQAEVPICGNSGIYGYNDSAWFTAAVYGKINCNTDLVDRYENILAILGPPAAPLGDNYTREQRLCYFEGYYNGLVDRVADEYEKCESRIGDLTDRFACIPLETLANYAANLLMSVNKSIEDLSETDLERIFGATPHFGVCEEVVPGESCTEKVTEILTDNMTSDDEDLMKIFITEFCPAGSGDDDEPDGGV